MAAWKGWVGGISRSLSGLITCGGSFDFSTGQYVDNIIDFASLTGSH